MKNKKMIKKDFLMKCKYFGKCGSCILWEGGYEKQLKIKVENGLNLLKEFNLPELEIFSSPSSHFRARGEFGFNGTSFLMHSVDREKIKIGQCPIVLNPIFVAMPQIKDKLKENTVLSKGLFRIDFLSSLSGKMLVSLIYHKKLDLEWRKEAEKLQRQLNIFIIGRSRRQKVALAQDFIIEEFSISKKKYKFIQYENSFTQPNPFINQKMLEWVKKNSEKLKDDLLELYCGNGNFSIVLGENFKKILATEISKSSIKAAKENLKLNSISNIKFVRLSAQEFLDAFTEKREFNRLKNEKVKLKEYNFSTIKNTIPPIINIHATV